VPSLREFQSTFAAALRGDSSPPSAEAQPAVAVHRNTVALGLREALAGNYPTVRRLVGDAWFDAAAALFALRHPPRDGVLARYGDGYAEFLQGFEPARELPYLPDVARLDRAWTEAHLAPDAPVLEARALAALAPGDLEGLRLVTHPSVRALRFDGPAFTIWRRHRENAALDEPLEWRAENALVLRPVADVRWWEIEAGALEFVSACAEQASIAGALERAADVQAWPALVAAGAFTRLERLAQRNGTAA